MKVVTIDDAGRRLDVFHDRWSGFSVTPAERIDCRVNASGAIAWLPLRAEVACFDATGQLADIKAMTMGPQDRLFRALLGKKARARYCPLFPSRTLKTTPVLVEQSASSCTWWPWTARTAGSR